MSWCLTVLVPNCLFQRVPKCLGAELSFSTGAELSWCRTVLFPQRPERAESEIITSLDQIILSFRKPFLSFYIYLLLIWLYVYFYFFLLLSNNSIQTISTNQIPSPLHFGSKTWFDWSKSFEWLRRCQHRLKRWPIKMGFRGVIWANVYGGARWICLCLWAHTRKNWPKFQHFQKGSDLTNFTIDSFCC
jgi:hypothetical protein